MSSVEIKQRPTKTPREAAAALMRLNETLRSKLRKAEEELDSLRSSVTDLEQENRTLKEEIAMASMHLAGLEAELEAFHEEARYCRLLVKSEAQFSDGTYKTHGRLVYEKAFDEEARRQGFSTTQGIRPD